MAKLVLLFTVVPLIELYLLTVLGQAIGLMNTIAIVIVTGLLGGWLARLEGGRVWRKWQAALGQGRLPDEGVLGGVLLLVGGVLLIAPGVLTDFVGLLLLAPPTRKLIANKLVRPWLEGKVKDGAVKVVSSQGVSFGVGGDPLSSPDVGSSPFSRVADVVEPDAVFQRAPARVRRGREVEVIDADFEVVEGERRKM